MIVPLAESYVKQVVAIHASELPSSFLVRLGKEFLEKFYYRHLIESPQAVGIVYLVEDKIAGFAIGATHANTFFDHLVRCHFFDLVKVLWTSFYKNPRLGGSIYKAAGFFLSKPKGHQTESKDAEVITLAVLPEFRTLDFFKERGIKVAYELGETILERFKAMGVERVKAFIDPSNFFATVFYKNLGFRYVRSLEKYDVEFHLYLRELSRSS